MQTGTCWCVSSLEVRRVHALSQMWLRPRLEDLLPTHEKNGWGRGTS